MNNYVVLTSGPSVSHTRRRQLADSPSSLRRKQASAGRLINKEGSVPVRSRHPRCRSLTSCPPAFRTRSLRAPHPHPPGAAESIAEQFPSTGRGPDALGASADPRLPGGELRARAARRCRGSAARVPVGAHSRAPAGRPHAGTPRPLAAVAAGRRAGSRGCAPAAAACFATAAEDLVGGGRDSASRPASKLSRTLLRGARGGGDACALGAGCGADGAALGGLPGGGGPRPLRPPRQWRPHDRAHQRIIAARDISADTVPAGGGVGGERLSLQGATSTCPALSPPPRRQRQVPLPHPVPPAPWAQRHPPGPSDPAGTPFPAGVPRPSESVVPPPRRVRRLCRPSPAASSPGSRASGALAAAGELWRARPHPGGAADSPAPGAALLAGSPPSERP